MSEPRRIRGEAAGWHARAPARVDFAGGWTDVPRYAEEFGGTVVNAAISCYVHADVLRCDSGLHFHAEDLRVRVRYRSPGEIRYDGRLDIHKAALNMLPVTGGLEVLTRSELPPGSGLGSSGALDVALCAALGRARGEAFERAELAELGFQVETQELKLLGGRQDQYAAALGGFNHLTFGTHGVGGRSLAVGPEQAADLAAHAVLLYTGESHFSSSTHERVWAAYEKEGAVRTAVRRIHEVAEAAGPALEAADWTGLARLIDENWRHQQQLDPTIASPGSRRIEEAVRQEGAWGLKAMGAGAGGCLLVLGPPSRRKEIERVARAAGARLIEFGFDFDGVATWETVHADLDAG